MSRVLWAHLPAPGGDAVAMAIPTRFDALGDAVLRGTYAPSPPAQLVFDLVSPGSVLLDLGAHLGVVALVAARLGARVIAVEAAPGNAECLRASRNANGFSNLQVIEAAVSNRPGVLLFREDGAYGQVTDERGTGVVEVRAAPVVGLLEGLGLERVDIVKMDVEGHEPEAIDGMHALLAPPDAPPVVFESNLHTLHRTGATPAQLLRRFEEHGYRTFLVGDGELTEADSSSFQVETVSDYLATKGPTPSRWKVRGPLSDDEIVERSAIEARHPLRHSRAAIARALVAAPPSLRRRSDVAAIIEALALDPDRAVADAARTTADDGPAEASEGGPRALAASALRGRHPGLRLPAGSGVVRGRHPQHEMNSVRR